MKRYKNVPESRYVRYVEFVIDGHTSPHYQIVSSDRKTKEEQIRLIKTDLQLGKVKNLLERTGVCYIRTVDREGCVSHYLMDETITEVGKKRFYPESSDLTNDELYEIALDYQSSCLATYEELLEEQKRGWLVSLTLICGDKMPRDYDPTSSDDGIYDEY